MVERLTSALEAVKSKPINKQTRIKKRKKLYDKKKSLVTKLVTDIDGVNSVINNMTIAVPVASRN